MAKAPGAVPVLYTDDAGKQYYVPLHAYLSNAQNGTQAAPAGAGKWPFKRNWMRHIGVLFSDGTRDEIPIMSITNNLYTVGGAITVVFPSGSRSGVVTGRRGEKMHLTHTLPTP